MENPTPFPPRNISQKRGLACLEDYATSPSTSPSAMTRPPAGNWASPAACSTAGEIGTWSTVEMGFIASATRGAEVSPRPAVGPRQRFWHLALSYPTCGPGFYARQLAPQHVRPVSGLHPVQRQSFPRARHADRIAHRAYAPPAAPASSSRPASRESSGSRALPAVPPTPPGITTRVRCGLFLRCGPYHPATAGACTSDHAVRFLVDSLLPVHEAGMAAPTDRRHSLFRCGGHDLGISHRMVPSRATPGQPQRLQSTQLAGRLPASPPRNNDASRRLVLERPHQGDSGLTLDRGAAEKPPVANGRSDGDNVAL